MPTYDVEKALDALGISYEARGSYLIAKCPRNEIHYRGDKTPSWSIKKDLGIHHCWSCGYSGRLEGLVVDSRSLPITRQNMQDAEDWLLEIAKSQIKEPNSQYLIDFNFVYSMKEPLGVYGVGQPLETWAKIPREYLQITRKVPSWQVEGWGLGYTSGGRLDGRIWLPVRDRLGRLSNYNARTCNDSEPRYLHAKKEERLQLGVLFGEMFWSSDPSSATVFVTEGEFNALAVQRAFAGWVGTNPWWAVASLGGSSNRSVEHLLKLSTFKNRVVLADNDQAGKNFSEYISSNLKCDVIVNTTDKDWDELEPDELYEILYKREVS